MPRKGDFYGIYRGRYTSYHVFLRREQRVGEWTFRPSWDGFQTQPYVASPDRIIADNGADNTVMIPRPEA